MYEIPQNLQNLTFFNEHVQYKIHVYAYLV